MTSTRLPCNLLYLTIFNPTLRPSQGIPSDDEDAEEQAQILFYTSKERAVSRDKMLRQVGLAKALITFADIFSLNEPCDNIHSQSRRMVMVSPEPDFWIHAAVELARSPRTLPVEKSKGKPKDKDKETAAPPTAFDAHESSAHDIALRTDILLAYEQFKLRHGSFRSILDKAGHEALELELERHFTVWAWSWNLQKGNEFGGHLGLPMHPQYLSLRPALDDLTDKISNHATGIAVTPTHIIPSTNFSQSNYPPSLARFLSSLLRPPSTPSTPPDKEQLGKDSSQSTSAIVGSDSPSTFLGLPSSAVNMSSMDMRKWNWPGYLTFGKNSRDKSPLPPAVTEPSDQDEEPHSDAKEETSLDKDALEEAMSDNMSIHTLQSSVEPRELNTDAPDSSLVDEHNDTLEPKYQEDIAPSIQWLSTKIFVGDTEDITADVQPVKVTFSVDYPVLLAFVGMQDDPLDEVSSESARLLQKLKEIPLPDANVQTLPSVNKILLTKDQCIVSLPPEIWSEEPFASESIHLFNAQALLTSKSNIQEVYSRGQNPQHWHVGRRGLESANEGEGEAYLEVFRKEASLTDVENTLVSLAKKRSWP